MKHRFEPGCVVLLCLALVGVGAGCNAVEKFKEGVKWADTKAKAVDADLNKKADVLEAKGINVDSGASGLIESAKANPIAAWEERGAYLSVLAAMIFGWVRTKKISTTASAALGVVTKAIEAAPPEQGDPIKQAVAASGGKAPGIDAAIQKSLV